jgi:predicted DNA-binding transcriptional regulator AlpA
MEESKKRFLTVEETARTLCIKKRTIYNRICKSAEKPFPIPHKKLFGRVVFESEKVDEFLANLKEN